MVYLGIVTVTGNPGHFHHHHNLNITMRPPPSGTTNDEGSTITTTTLLCTLNLSSRSPRPHHIQWPPTSRYGPSASLLSPPSHCVQQPPTSHRGCWWVFWPPPQPHCLSPPPDNHQRLGHHRDIQWPPISCSTKSWLCLPSFEEICRTRHLGVGGGSPRRRCYYK